MRRLFLWGVGSAGLGMVVAVAFVGTALALTPSAEPTLGVTNPLAIIDVVPGHSYTHTMSVTGGAEPQGVRVEVTGLGQGLDGASIALPPSEDNGSYSGRRFITRLDNSSFLLEPGKPQKVEATIEVPHDFGNEARFAALRVITMPRAGGVVSTRAAILVPVIMVPAGARLTEAGRIAELVVSESRDGKSLAVRTVAENTGNGHFRMGNEVRVTNDRGEMLGTAMVPPSFPSVIPGFRRQFPVNVFGTGRQTPIPPGEYVVESRVTLPDGATLDARSARFTIEGRSAQGMSPD